MKEGSEAIGAKLIKVDHDECQVTLYTDRGILTLSAQGDCCSTSWFESTEEHGAVGGEITELDLGYNIPCNDVTGEPGKFSDSQVLAYFPVIKTTTGRVMLEMRNASNGFYGGSIGASWAPAGQ